MKLKSYAAAAGEKPFNWFRALSKDCAKMDEPEAWSLYVQAESWTTCACGNQCAIIPRGPGGQPVDRTLSKLGIRFSEMVGGFWGEIYYRESEPLHLKRANEHRLSAIAILHKIEKRSAFLIERILKKKGAKA